MRHFIEKKKVYFKLNKIYITKIRKKNSTF